MIFYGLNIAAFKIPLSTLPDVWEDMRDECFRLEEAGCFLPHNMQVGRDNWRTAAIKSPLGNWRLSDPAFYRHLPEIKPISGPILSDRLKYREMWAYTEIATHCPVTTAFCQDVEDIGSFMSGARYLKMEPNSAILYHHDNNPNKEFRLTVGLSGMEEENFVVHTGTNKWTTLPMKEGEAWFIDVGLGHAVSNPGKNARYRLGAQLYGPPSDRLLKLLEDSQEIIYAEQLRVGAPFQDVPI